jgi:hypothetical protein
MAEQRRKFPGLDELADNPELAASLTKVQCALLLARGEKVHATICVRARCLMGPQRVTGESGKVSSDRESGSAVTDRWLTPDEAAEITRQSRAAIYRLARRWPFAKRVSRKRLLVSQAGLNKWLAALR